MWSKNIVFMLSVILNIYKSDAIDNCNTIVSGYDNVTDIHIIGFFPCTDPDDTRGIPVDNCDGIERIPIMKLALEEMNERCDLLPGYRLVVDYANSACSSIPAIYHLIQQTDPSQPTKLMILGPACSAAAEIMGEIAERFMHIPQVSYTASSSVFASDKESYPRFYRLVPITEQIADGYVALVKELNWNRVVIISHDAELYNRIGLYTAEQLTSNRVLAYLSFIHGPSHIVNTIKDLNARIIIAWIPQSVAAAFWCMAIRENLAGPDFVWFFPGWYRANWWAAVDDTDCTAEEMSRALEHSLGGRGKSILDIDLTRVLVSDKTVMQFRQDLDAKTALGTVATDVFLSVGYVYDAVWTIALALNSSISILEERGLGRLEDFTYDSVEMADVITEAILNTSFQGISGKVSFQNNGNRNDPLIALVQYRSGTAVPVMIYNNSRNFIKLHGQSLMWQGGYIPLDAPSPTVQSDRPFEIGVIITAAVLGIISTIYFFAFNIYYRNNLIVKRSSYRLNSLILAAALVGFVGTLLHAIQLDSDDSYTSAAIVCNIRHWMTEMAFIVCFATFFVKIWRLYKLFFNKQLAELNYLKDQNLLLIVAVLASPTLLVLIIQAALFPMTLHTHNEINEEAPAQQEIFFTCEAEHYLIFDALLLTYDIILALLNAFVAFQTKKHLPMDNKYQKYHESAVINLTTVMAVIPSSVCELIVILLLTSNNKDGILLLITLRECFWLYPVIFVLFTPKLYRVYHGILQSRKQLPSCRILLHQDSLHNCMTSIGKDAFPNIALHQKRRRLSEPTPIPFIISNDNNISEYNEPDCLQQQPVSLSLDHDSSQERNVSDDFVVITNKALVSETNTIAYTNSGE